MYSIIHDLLSDRKGDEVFRCFGIWHLVFIASAIFAVALIFFLTRKKSEGIRRKVPVFLINFSFGLYVLDFFLMPFAYETIDIEKLPFHVCTAMCVMCFLSRHVTALEKFRMPFALLGFVSNLVYFIYPAGVMWHGVHPISYRVIQTLLFHASMAAYGFFTFAYDKEGLNIRKWPRDLLTVSLMTLWATLGNILYRGEAGSYSHDFNWFFTEQDPFGMIPKHISVYVMPFLNVAVFFAAEMLVYGICYLIRTAARKIGCRSAERNK